MISSSYYIAEFWHATKKEIANVNAIIQQVYKQNIYAFSCYGQHHISGDAPTFNNDSVYKLDWIVGKERY